MNRSLAPAAVLSLALLLPNGTAQQPEPAAQPLPSDPVALMQLAWQQNGLHDADLKPWHVRATWTEVEQKGQPTSTGTWDEWWAGDNKYKISYTSGSFQQTLFVTDHGPFVLGNPDPPDWNFELVQEAVSGLLPDPQHLSKSSWHQQHQKHGAIEITCAKNKSGDQYCFGGDLPAVRVSTTSTVEKSADSLVRFQGRYLARRVKVLQVGLPEVDISIDQIEPIPTVLDSDFLPPQGAAAGGTALVADTAMAEQRLAGDPVGYPVEARFERVSGVVWIEVIVRPDGSVVDARGISGPLMLQASAIKAVKTWRYKRYVLDGKPVDVRTRISVIYQIGG